LTERPARGVPLVDVLIDIARSEYPNEWLRYCDLAQQLAPQRKDEQGRNISREGCARIRLSSRDPNTHALIADFCSSLLGEAPSQLQEMTWEASRLAGVFRDRLLSMLRSGEYLLTGFTPDLRLVSVPPELIGAELLRCDRDEIELWDTIIMGVRAAPASDALSSQAPGPRPGYGTPKALAHNAVHAILANDAERPPKGYGRTVKLARMVQAKLAYDGVHYQPNSIEKMIRPALKEWEKRNPDK
jgi:hypothetical protein